MGDGCLCAVDKTLLMRLCATIAAALALSLLSPASAADGTALPSCNLAKLPDPLLINIDGKLRIRTSKPVASDGDITYYLAELVDCGAVIRIRPRSVNDRTALLNRLPDVAARLLAAETSILKLAVETNRNGYPLEIWSAGTGKYFLVMTQMMDAEPAYLPSRGTVCIGYTELPVAIESRLQAIDKHSLDWANAMERLANACMDDTPADSASRQVIAAMKIVRDDLDRAARGIIPPQKDEASLKRVLQAAQLNPRPANWPQRQATSDD